MKVLIGFLAALIMLSGAAFAGINYEEPASMLIFPFFSSDTGEDTVISVTNINTNTIYNPAAGRPWGDVVAHFFYVDAEDCDITDRREFLTPGDLLTVLASRHNPAMNKGFLIIVAEDPNFMLPVKWDGIQTVIPNVLEFDSGLIGDCIVANGILNFSWSVPAIGIKAAQVPVGTILDTIDDLAFGLEYEPLPSKLFVSSFVEQGFLNTRSTLILLNPTASKSTVKLLYLFYNNDEVEFSQTDDFSCWMVKNLDAIFNGSDNLGGKPAVVPTGWIAIESKNSPQKPVLGMIVQAIASSDYSSARLLHHTNDYGVTGAIDL